jgi:tRNA A58 N-methylase Trm61
LTGGDVEDTAGVNDDDVDDVDDDDDDDEDDNGDAALTDARAVTSLVEVVKKLFKSRGTGTVSLFSALFDGVIRVMDAAMFRAMFPEVTFAT